MGTRSLRDYLFYEEPGITLYCGDLDADAAVVQFPDSGEVRVTRREDGGVEAARTDAARDGARLALREILGHAKGQHEVGLTRLHAEPRPEIADALGRLLVGDDPVVHGSPVALGRPSTDLDVAAPAFREQHHGGIARLADADALTKRHAAGKLRVADVFSDRDKAVRIQDAGQIREGFAHAA